MGQEGAGRASPGFGALRIPNPPPSRDLAAVAVPMIALHVSYIAHIPISAQDTALNGVKCVYPRLTQLRSKEGPLHRKAEAGAKLGVIEAPWKRCDNLKNDPCIELVQNVRLNRKLSESITACETHRDGLVPQ